MFKFSFRQQVLTGFAFAVVLVFIVAILSYRSIDQLEADQAQANHTQQVIRSTRNILQLLIDAETGARGYFAAGQRVFLDPYNASLQNINAELSTLRNLTQDNEGDALYSDSLINLTEVKLRVMKENIDTRDSKGLDYIISNNLMLNGKIAMDNIRSLIKRIETRQNKLLNERKLSTQQAARYTVIVIVVGSLIFLIIIIFLFSYIQKSFAVQKRIEKEITETNNSLEKVLAENENKNWLLTGGSLLSERIQGEQSEKELTNNILTKMCRYTGALTGTLYLFNEDEDFLDLYAYYAFHDVSQLKQRINKSEGWVGQVARDQRSASIKGKLNDKLQLQTSVVSQELAEIVIVPFFFDKKLKGVMELGYQTELKQIQREFIDSSTPTIGVAVNTAQARTIMRDLFEETQQQAEELEAQQEEMRVTNEELLSKTEMLQASEEELRVQQEELRTINAELEEKASLLEEKNQAIEEARAAISVKANELETTGKYKSEFLANMSHELRTPLNSILVLARILKDNKTANLSDDQIKYASVIFNAGNDLLTLINDILDLSKIESGKMDIQNEDVQVADILKDMEMLFNEVALNKKISFTSSISNVSDSIYTDKTRVEQVIKNLLSNAFKFTPENGKISVDVTAGSQPNTISFHVKDSGIGIPEAKQKIIFEAFQQADGSTSRKYGGTGLGLSISRELTALLGGYITLESTPGVGSKFTLTLPVRASQTQPHEEEVPTVEDFNVSSNFLKPAAALTRPVDKNREPLVVIVEDDKNFADILRDYAQEHGYKSVMINDGLGAVQAVKDNQPDAVILDIMLPGKDGWQILKELKKDEATMHIPVHLMSAGEAAANRVRKEGAISFMKKPINTETLDKLFGDVMKQSGIEFKQILLVEDHEAQSQALKELMQKQGIAVDQAYTAEEAFNKLNANEYQCVILDLNLPDMSGLDLLDKIKGVDRFAELPVIINTAMELDKNAVSRLMQYANAMVMKTNKSADRLIDEVNLFLHKISSTPAPKPTALGVQSSPVAKPVIGVSNRKDLLKGKKVLIVDDDMRNIFALSSALQSYDIKVEIANDGEEALTKLEELPDVDMVLMDIMMPKMDGYEATRAIRKHSKWTRLPVIALTAKAMKDDREKCIAAGANDYITKPVDMDRLISLMQLWLGN